MKYFQTLPKIVTSDYVGNQILMTNLMVRVNIVDSLLKNPLLFYSYNIKDSDTPEIIADKYYGDPYRYWLVLFSNQIIDPQWNWPMSSNLFNDYIVSKYTSLYAIQYNVPENTVTPAQILAYTQSQIKNYVKTITTIDNSSGETTSTDCYIQSGEYALVQEGTIIRTFPSGGQVTQTISKYVEYLYDYEVRINEAKRSIFIINSEYASQFETQLQKLLR
jgi:hypothetical protein